MRVIIRIIHNLVAQPLCFQEEWRMHKTLDLFERQQACWILFPIILKNSRSSTSENILKTVILHSNTQYWLHFSHYCMLYYCDDMSHDPYWQYKKFHGLILKDLPRQTCYSQQLFWWRCLVLVNILSFFLHGSPIL